MKVQMRIEYHYAKTLGISLLQSTDERQRYQMVASQRDSHASSLTGLAGNRLCAFEGVVSSVNDPQVVRETGEIELGGNPALVLERVDDACAADGIRRFIGSEAGVEGFGRARSWGIESVAVSHEDPFVWDSHKNNI
jgi:hypothetical protein